MKSIDEKMFKYSANEAIQIPLFEIKLPDNLSLICAVNMCSVEEAWLGVRVADGRWTWENGMEATEQRYFRGESFNNISSALCAKAVIKRPRKNVRTLDIREEECSANLAVICQFSKLGN